MSSYQIHTMNSKFKDSNLNLSNLSQSTKSRNFSMPSLSKLVNPDLFNFKLIFLCLIWYFTSVISSSTTKKILKDFKYPCTLTEIQFVINALLCLMLLSFVKFSANKDFNLYKKFPNGTFPPQLPNFHYSIPQDFLKPSYLILKTTVPMGMFQFLGQIASHNATSIIPVSLVHTIKALSPISTVLIYRFLFKKQFSAKTYLTLLPLITGVMLSCTKNDKLRISDNMFFKGSVYAFISMLIFVSQNIFAKKILTWDDNEAEDLDELDNRRAKAFLNRINWKITRSESAISTPILPTSISPPKTPKSYFSFNNPNYSSSSLSDLALNDNDKEKFMSSSKKLDKVSVLFYCSIIGFFLTLPFYCISEFRNDVLSLYYLNSEILKLIMYYGVSHFIQSLMAFQILGMISPVNYSIANILKRIIIISCSLVIEDIQLNFQQWLGLSLTFIGLYSYDRWGAQKS